MSITTLEQSKYDVELMVGIRSGGDSSLFIYRILAPVYRI